jgi:hypothetical protein
MSSKAKALLQRIDEQRLNALLRHLEEEQMSEQGFSPARQVARSTHRKIARFP